MRTYEFIPTNVKPPPGAAKLHYANAFDSEFTLLLRERRSTSLENMIQDVIEVEVNLSTSNKTKQRGDNRRVKEEAKVSTSQSSTDAKIDLMMKAMERLIDQFSMDGRGQNLNRERNEPQIKNPNFRKPRQPTPQPPQILQREKRNNNDQLRRSFHQNQVVDNEFPQKYEDHINHVGDSENRDEDEVPPFYISLRIHNMFLHNTMLDSGASHNLMPKVIMDNLGLDITRDYKDLYSFDSRKVKCIGLIKDLVVSLHQILEKSILMHVVVADVPL